jgi:Ca-activated chloride channel homolog
MKSPLRESGLSLCFSSFAPVNFVGTVGLALALLALVAPVGRAAAPQKTPEVRVPVNLVQVVASVLDRNRRPVPDLPQGAFRVYEEGKEQTIEFFQRETNQPLDLALMIDTSLSMTGELKFERRAAGGFIRELLRPGDTVALFQFAYVVTELSDFSSRVPRLEAALERIRPGTGTSLYDAIYLGSAALERRPRGRRRVIVLMTDAGETTSRSDFDSARQAALRSGAMLYTILVRPVKSESGRNTAGEHAVATITDVSGGGMFTADTPGQLLGIFDRINRELRTQYLLGYYPNPRPPANSYRRIDVRVAGQGYLVRHRQGYFTRGAIE